jgi:hypothetical protein
MPPQYFPVVVIDLSPASGVPMLVFPVGVEGSLDVTVYARITPIRANIAGPLCRAACLISKTRGRWAAKFEARYQAYPTHRQGPI